MTVVQTKASVQLHWRKHAVQHDMEIAEDLLASALRDLFRVYQNNKKNTNSFVDYFDTTYFLIIPVKCLSSEA